MENWKRLPEQRNNRVLIVDDNPGIHEDFRKILQSRDDSLGDFNRKEALLFDEAPPASALPEGIHEGFEVDSAFQGQEGLEMVRRALEEGRPYAMAFVDVRMPPGWDGVETISQIWRNYPQLQVVICSAYSDYSWTEITRKLGASDALLILKKPFDNVEVLQLAHALTKKWLVTEQAGIRMSDLDDIVRQRTEELAIANERFAKAFRLSPLPMAISRLSNAGVLDINESFLKLFQFARDSVIGQTDQALGIWVDPAVRDNFWTLVQRDKRVSGLKCELRTRSGDIRQVLAFSEELQLNQERCALVLFHDVTEHIRLEEQIQQSQKMQAVGQLAAGVAHDFNNLITVIRGHAEMRLRAAELDREVDESLKQIVRASERAACLTRQLLAFGRRHLIQPSALNLGNLLVDLQGMVQSLLTEKTHLRVESSEKLPTIIADRWSLEQALVNLIINARDAMPEGGTLTIRAAVVEIHSRETIVPTTEARSGSFVRISVEDTGQGMDKATLNRIFEPFFTTKPIGKGTGMGLAMVYAIVKQHGGWVQAFSQPGFGSTFHLFLPVSEQPVDHAPPLLGITPAVEHKTILVVESNPDLRAMTADVLSSVGYQILQASSGTEALKTWDSHSEKIDLLLTDLTTPQALPGDQLAEKLCARKPELKVVLTSDYTAIHKGQTSGVFGATFISKPYSAVALVETVRGCFDAQPETAQSN